MDQFYRTAVALIYVLTTWTTVNVNGDNDFVVARKGTRTILPCLDQKQLKDVSSLTWMKTSDSTNIELFNKFDEDDLVVHRPEKYSVSYSYQLEILNVDASDAGSYRCDYRKSALVTSRTTDLYVAEVYIEECSDVEGSICRVDGSSDSLTCKFSGFPSDITASWQHIPSVLDKQGISRSEELGDEAVLDEQSIIISEELGDGAVLNKESISRSEELGDGAVLDKQSISRSEELGDGTVLDKQNFISSGELVMSYDRESENKSFVCRVSDDSGGNSSRYDPFEQTAQYVSGHEDIPDNKKVCVQYTTIIFIVVAIALLMIVLFIGLCWKRTRDSTKHRGYSQKDRKSDQEGQQLLKWKVVTKKLSAADSMKCMTATPDGKMAVGYTGGECGIAIYTADGEQHQRVLQGVQVYGIGFLSNGRCVVDSMRPATDDKTIRGSLYTRDWTEVDEKEFESPIWHDGGSNDLTVDSDDHIFVCKKNKVILVIPPKVGEPVKEIKCNWYTPDQIFAMQSSKKVVVKDSKSALVINESHDVQQKLTITNVSSVYPALRKDDTILIATVSEERDRVTIEHYTSELKYEATLIKNHVIEKSDKDYYYLQEFTSGEIAFCTRDRLYIFSDGV